MGCALDEQRSVQLSAVKKTRGFHLPHRMAQPREYSGVETTGLLLAQCLRHLCVSSFLWSCHRLDGGTLPQVGKVAFLQKYFVKVVLPPPLASGCGIYPQLWTGTGYAISVELEDIL